MYTLYFAPDNASLIVRIVLEEIGADFTARSVDRSAREQESEAYRKLNPNGLIPVCVMDGEPVFETAAIVLSLADRHGELAPKADDPTRPGFLKWLFFLSNTVHTDLRMLFYPTQYVGADDAHQQALKSQAWDLLQRHLSQLEHHYAESNGAYLLGPDPSIADIYLGLCLRWPQLYPPAIGANSISMSFQRSPEWRPSCRNARHWFAPLKPKEYLPPTLRMQNIRTVAKERRHEPALGLRCSHF